MTGKDERGEARLSNLNPQLLGELTDQAFLGGFAGNKLTAGKFPQPGERFTNLSLIYENPALDIT